MFKKLASSLAASAIIATGALAANPTIATDGTGDFLVAPAYFTTGGYKTSLKLVNTNLTNSILVRVVVRDYVSSKEVDFPIFLSPSDVWTAEISAIDGRPTIVSNDDSNFLAEIMPTGTTQYFDVNGIVGKGGIDLNKRNSSAAFNVGYVEFYPIAQYNEGIDSILSKKTLEERYLQLKNGVITDGGSAVDENSLTGFVTMSAGETMAMTLPLLAIEGMSDAVVTGTYLSEGQDTRPVDYFGTANTTALYQLLQKEFIYVPFNRTVAGSETNVVMTAWADYATTQTRSFTTTLRNNLEQRPQLPSPYKPSAHTTTGELSLVSVDTLVDSTYVNPLLTLQMSDTSVKEGWLRIENLQNTSVEAQQIQTIDPTDNWASVIPTVMMAVPTENGAADVTWSYLPFKYLR